MKKTFILSLLLLLISCGKDNKSGVPDTAAVNPVVVQVPEDEGFKKAYHDMGVEILREYSDEIRRILGPDINHRMRKNLHYGKIMLSHHLITDSRGQYTSSLVQQDGVLVLYAGDQEPSLNWHRLITHKSIQLDQMILHNLLELSGVDDSNMRISRRIVRQNR